MQRSQTVGRHYSYQVIAALTRTLPDIWLEASREEHRKDTPAFLSSVFAGVRSSGLFALCREVRDAGGEPLNAEHQAVERLNTFFGRMPNSSRLAAAFCDTVTELATAVETVRQAAKLESDPQKRKSLDIGFFTLKRQLSRLLATGVLAELPVTSQNVSCDELLLHKVAGVILERRAVYRTASTDSRFENWIRANLAESMGSRLFDGVRAQERHRAEICVEGLARYMSRPHPRFRRAMFADPAHGLHEIFEIAVRHANAIQKAKPGSIQRTRRRNASLISWITVVEVLRTGFLREAHPIVA